MSTIITGADIPEEFEAELPEDTTFTVHDDDSANWVIRKILESRAYAQRCAEWSDREQARAKREEEFFFFRYGQQLLDYARQKIAAAGGRRKSVSLPAGSVGFRTVPAHVVVDNDEAVIAWAKRYKPDLVRVIEQLSRSGLSDHIKTTGEIPEDGIHIEPSQDKFYVK